MQGLCFLAGGSLSVPRPQVFQERKQHLIHSLDTIRCARHWLRQQDRAVNNALSPQEAQEEVNGGLSQFTRVPKGGMWRAEPAFTPKPLAWSDTVGLGAGLLPLTHLTLKDRFQPLVPGLDGLVFSAKPGLVHRNGSTSNLRGLRTLSTVPGRRGTEQNRRLHAGFLSAKQWHGASQDDEVGWQQTQGWSCRVLPLTKAEGVCVLEVGQDWLFWVEKQTILKGKWAFVLVTSGDRYNFCTSPVSGKFS